MSEPALPQPRDVQFPVWGAVVALPADPDGEGTIEVGDAVVAVSRVRGTAPGDPDVPADTPGVAVWSFAPHAVEHDALWPARHAVLGLVGPFGAQTGMSLRQSALELDRRVESGGTAIALSVDGRPASGRTVAVDRVGSVVWAVQPPYSFAAVCCGVPPVLEFAGVV